MIRESVTLLFDPEKAEPNIQKAFADPLAKTLWLAVRQGHLISDEFHANCVRYANVIRNAMEKKPLTAEMLYRIISGTAAGPMDGIIGPSERGFAAELLPFVLGDKQITYEVQLK